MHGLSKIKLYVCFKFCPRCRPATRCLDQTQIYRIIIIVLKLSVQRPIATLILLGSTTLSLSLSLSLSACIYIYTALIGGLILLSSLNSSMAMDYCVIWWGHSDWLLYIVLWWEHSDWLLYIVLWWGHSDWLLYIVLCSVWISQLGWKDICHVVCECGERECIHGLHGILHGCRSYRCVLRSCN